MKGRLRNFLEEKSYTLYIILWLAKLDFEMPSWKNLTIGQSAVSAYPVKVNVAREREEFYVHYYPNFELFIIES